MQKIISLPIIYSQNSVDTPPETPTPSSPEGRAADLDPDLEDFCNRFDLDLAVENVSEEDEKRDQEDLSDKPEICTQTELDLFSSALQEAQWAAIEAEQRVRERKSPKTYTGGSKKTAQWRKMEKERMNANGYFGVFEYIEMKKLLGGPRAQADHTAGSLSGMEDSDQQVHPNASAVDQQADLNASVVDQQADPDAIIDNPVNPDTHNAIGQEEEESNRSVESKGQEDEDDDLENRDSDQIDPEDRSLTSALENLKQQRDLLDDLDPGPLTSEENALDIIRNVAQLRAACAALDLRSKDQTLDSFLRARIITMAGTLNIYLDPDLGHTWRNASLLVAKTQGHGEMHARNIRRWILSFLHDNKLPHHKLKQPRWSVLHDEDVSQDLQLQLTQRTKD